MFAFLSTAAYFIVETLFPFSPGGSVAEFLLPAVTRSVEAATAFAFLSAAAYFIVETLLPFPPGASLPESCCSFSV